MAAYEVDAVVVIRTVVNHPSLEDKQAAQNIGLGRIHTLLQAGIDTEAILNYEVVAPFTTELETT